MYTRFVPSVNDSILSNSALALDEYIRTFWDLLTQAVYSYSQQGLVVLYQLRLILNLPNVFLACGK